MNKKRITIRGIIELSDGEEERHTDTVLFGNNGSVYLLDASRMGDDIYEWLSTNAKVSGWRYRLNGYTFIEVTDITEIEPYVDEFIDEDAADAMLYLDEDELRQISSLERE